MKSAQWLRSKMLLFEVFFSIFIPGGHFVQWSRTIWAILLEDLQRNNPINFGWNLPSSYGGDVIWRKLWMTHDEQSKTDAGHRAITIVLPKHVVLRWAKYRFSRWRPSWISNPPILAGFGLQVTLMLSTKFQVNWPLGSEAKNRLSK